jgi:hypothetical protein
VRVYVEQNKNTRACQKLYEFETTPTQHFAIVCLMTTRVVLKILVVFASLATKAWLKNWVRPSMTHKVSHAHIYAKK